MNPQKLVYWIIGLLVYLIIPLHQAEAAGEFLADYDVQYAIAPSGVAIVTQNVTLTNQQTNLYAQKYSIIIDSVKIKNIIAYDNLGIIRPDVKQTNGKTEIILNFNEKIVGVGKQLPFSLRYESTDIAVQNGSIWEVNIPSFAPDPDLQNYSVSLNVPPNFGPNAYMSPLPVGGKWTKQQMTEGGVSAAYGNTQAFDLTLSYHLENPTIGHKLTEVALPPDTAYQKVFIKTLSPEPKNVLVDHDGNWLAQYELLPTQKLTVLATIRVSTFLAPRKDFTQSVDSEQYTRPLRYWESNNKQIQELAKLYTTPREIYDYVRTVLSYDYKRIRETPIRKGAVQALEAPANSICMEFADLFVAIARAAGIPARQAVGYAHTTNATLRPLSLANDVLHAWPEYYDPDRALWIPIDPTWANTTGGVNYFDKLDFNHIVFSYHGRSSEYPLPAGFYKKSGESSKDVSVQFATLNRDDAPSSITVNYDVPDTVTGGFALRGEILIENRGETAISGATVTIQSTPVDIALTQTLGTIPPHGKAVIPITISIPRYFYQSNGFIVTTAGDQVVKHDFTIVPLVYQFIWPILAILVVVAFLLFLWFRKIQ